MNLAALLRPSAATQSFLFASLLIIQDTTQLASRAEVQTHEQSTFAMEGVPLSHPVDLPENALQLMRKNAFVLSCHEEGPSPKDIPGEWFVASEVHLRTTHEADLLVMPRDMSRETSKSPADNACLFHAHSMPFWILIRNKAGYIVGLEEHAQVLRVLRSTSNRYRNIETKLSNLNESTTWIFRFDGHQYVRTGKTSIPTQ